MAGGFVRVVGVGRRTAPRRPASRGPPALAAAQVLDSAAVTSSPLRPPRCRWRACSATPPTRSQAVRAGAVAQRRAGALSGGGAAGHAGARLPRAALARRGRGGAAPARAEGAAAERRCAAADRARAALAGGRCRRTPSTRWSTRPWRRRAGARRRAPASSTPCCAASLREREAIVDAAARRPGRRATTIRAGGSSACAPTGPSAGRRSLEADNAASADDAARQRAPRRPARPTSRRRSRPHAASTADGARRPRGRAAPAAAGDAAAGLRRRRRSRSRTPPPSAPRRCCSAAGCRPARACSTPAPRPAARPRTCSSSPTSTCWRSTATRRGWRASTRRWPASACSAATLAADAARRRRLVGRPAVRRDPARRAVQRLGHRAPPSRRALAAPRRATSTALAATQARLLDALWPLLAPGRAAAVLHLFGVQGRGRGADRRFFATTRRAALRAAPAFARAPAAAARQSTRRPGRPASARAADGFFLRPDREDPTSTP